MRNTETRTADTRDMVIVHAALLRELRLAPALVDRAATADRQRVAQVADHVRFVLDLLDHHDAGEDRLIVLPLVELHLTASEWQQVGEAAMASIPKPKLPRR